MVRTGTPIRLIRPDKATLDTKIKVIAFNDSVNIVVGPEALKEDVPVGTEVWLIETP